MPTVHCNLWSPTIVQDHSWLYQSATHPWILITHLLLRSNQSQLMFETHASLPTILLLLKICEEISECDCNSSVVLRALSGQHWACRRLIFAVPARNRFLNELPKLAPCQVWAQAFNSGQNAFGDAETNTATSDVSGFSFLEVPGGVPTRPRHGSSRHTESGWRVW